MSFTEQKFSEKKLLEFVNKITEKENKALGYNVIQITSFIRDNQNYWAFKSNTEKNYISIQIYNKPYLQTIARVNIEDLNEELIEDIIRKGIKEYLPEIKKEVRQKFEKIEKEYLELKSIYEKVKAL